MANANASTAADRDLSDEAETAKPPGSKKKLLLLSAVALVVLGAAAGGALLLRGGDEAAVKAEPKAANKAPAQYIAMDPPFVVNFDAGASARFLQVAVQLMTRDLQMVDFLKSHDPVIRNDLLLLLGNQKVEDVASREGKERLRVAALDAVRAIVKGEGGDPAKLEAVYFTSFVMQ